MGPLPNLYPGVSRGLPGARKRYVMLGLGRQSTTLLLLAERGIIGPRPDAAICAPMDDEVSSAKDTLAMLQSPNFPCSIPILLTKPGEIAKEFDEACAGDRKRFPNPPYFTKDRFGQRGRLTRGCTRDYKIKAEIAAMKADLGYAVGARMPREPIVEQWIGISSDEALRMAAPPAPWIQNRYPLIEIGWTARDCVAWFESEYGVTLEKSGCRRCPNRSMHNWRALKARHPDDFAVACAADEAARHGLPNVREPAYISDRLRPLREIDFDAEIRASEGELLEWDDCIGGSCGI